MAPRARTVLLVDDNAKILQGLCNLFEAAGFHVCSAANGTKAIEQAAQTEPDLIILDLLMPGLNGLETAKVLRQTLPATPIILFTVYAESISMKEAAAAGISSVVPKTNVDMLISEAEAQLTPRKFSANC